jgi:hypothetical protein
LLTSSSAKQVRVSSVLQAGRQEGDGTPEFSDTETTELGLGREIRQSFSSPSKIQNNYVPQISPSSQGAHQHCSSQSI